MLPAGPRRAPEPPLRRAAAVVHFIPNGLYEILTEHAGKTVAEIKAAYEHELDEYFDFLLQNEFGFWCDGATATTSSLASLPEGGWMAPPFPRL